MSRVASPEAAVAAAAREEYQYYGGELWPPLGTAVWDPEEGVYAVRVREKNEEFSCGVECCGYAEYAVVAVPGEPPGEVVTPEQRRQCLVAELSMLRALNVWGRPPEEIARIETRTRELIALLSR